MTEADVEAASEVLEAEPEPVAPLRLEAFSVILIFVIPAEVVNT